LGRLASSGQAGHVRNSHQVGITVGKLALNYVLEELERFGSKNDRILERERSELALQWGAELKAAFRLVIKYLEERVENLDVRIVAPRAPRRPGHMVDEVRATRTGLPVYIQP
jgi:hypothetical protein